jgi:hypothetical protein
MGTRCSHSARGHTQSRLRLPLHNLTAVHGCCCFRDNLRTFFELTFPSLLKKVFGYDDYDASWLNIVAKVRAMQQLPHAPTASCYKLIDDLITGMSWSYPGTLRIVVL